MLFCLSVPAIVFAEIIETNSFDKIEQDLIQTNYQVEDILVIIAIRDVIFDLNILPTQNMDDKAKLKFYKSITKITPEKARYIYEISFLDYKKELLDKNLPQILQNLADKGIKTIGIINGLTGNFNNIKLESQKYEALKQFNIDFSSSFPNYSNVVFNNFAPYQNTYPTFYKGILHSNNIPEFTLITQFLYVMKLQPKLLILIHNDLEVLKSLDVQIKAYSSKINFIGYNYLNTEYQTKRTIDQSIILINTLISKANKVKRVNKAKKS